MRKENLPSHESGLGLLEVMLASVLLLIVSLVIASSIASQSKGTANLRSKSTCQETAQKALDYIKSLGTKDSILPSYFPDRPASQTWVPLSTSDLFGVNYNSQLNSSQTTLLSTWFSTSTGTEILRNDPVTGARLQLSSMIINSTGLLQNLYNSRRSEVCSGSGLSIKTLLYAGDPSGVPPEIQDVTIKIVPFDLASGTKIPSCPVNMFASPRGNRVKITPGFGQPSNNPTTDGFKVGGDTDLGFNVSVNVVTKGLAGGVPNTCSGEATYNYGSDAVNIGSLTLKPGSPSNIAGTIPYVLASAGTYWNSDTATDVKISFVANNEPGSTILCRNLNDPVKRYQSCDTVRLAAIEGGNIISPSALRLSGSGDLDFEFTGLSLNNKYRMGIILVDSAGNATPETTVVFRIGPCAEEFDPAVCAIATNECPLLTDVDYTFVGYPYVPCLSTTNGVISRYTAVMLAMQTRGSKIYWLPIGF